MARPFHWSSLSVWDDLDPPSRMFSVQKDFMWLQCWLCYVVPMACHCILKTVMAENISCDACCLVLVCFTNLRKSSRRHSHFRRPNEGWFCFRSWGRVPVRNFSSTSPTLQFGKEIIWFFLVEGDGTTALQKTVCSDHMDNQRPEIIIQCIWVFKQGETC